MDRTKSTQEHAKNMTNCWLKVPCGPSARCARIVRVVRRQQPELGLLKVNTSFPLPDLLNQPRDCYQIIDEGEVPLGDAIPTIL
jgi:hypothetical protein